jgi:acyl-CoA synthetase (AMP-forming)/AMP-acid ligase II
MPLPPPPATTLPLWLRQRSRQWPEATALVEGCCGSRYSHAALDHLVGRCAAGLAAQGFGPGDVLLMLAPNAPEWPIVALAAWVAGGAVCGAHPACSGDELVHQLRRWRVRHAFTTPALLPRLRACAASAANAATAAASGPLRLIVPGEAAGTVSFTTLLACADDEPQPPTGPHSLAWVGARRARNGPALQLSHGQVLVQIVAGELELQLSGRDVTLSLQPMGQASGFVQGALAPLAQGAAVVTLPRFDAAEVAQALVRHRVTRLLLAPPP